MIYVVEDGTGLSNATSYTTVQEFKDYWLAGGSLGIITVANSYTDAQIQGAQMVAAQYIDRNYSFKGEILNNTVEVEQNLAWPRQSVYDQEDRLIADDSVPDLVKQAHHEYTYHQLLGSLISVVSEKGIITEESKEIYQGMKTSKKYQEGTQAFSLRRYPYADSLMRGLTKGGIGYMSGSLVRGL